MTKRRIPSSYTNDVSKASHNWSKPVGGTIHPGLAYPIHHRHMNVGDRIRGDINALIQSQAMRGPLLNGFKQVTIATFTPDSVMYGWLRNGKRFSPAQYMNFSKFRFLASGDNLASYTDPVFKTMRYCRRLSYGLGSYASGAETPYSRWIDDTGLSSSNGFDHVGRGGLWDWLGVAPGAVAPRYAMTANSAPQPSPSFMWNVGPYFSYFLSFYYYIANMQEDNLYFTRSLPELKGAVNSSTLAELPFNVLFSSLNPDSVLDFLDIMSIKSASGAGADITSLVPTGSGITYSPILHQITSGIGAHGGLFAVPYSPDLFGNIIKQGSSPSVDVEVHHPEGDDNGTFAIPQLRIQNQIQNWVDRLFVSGGRIGDVFRTLWGTKSSPYINKPDFLGVWQAAVNPSNVVATANGEADGESANVGQMAARIDRYSNFSGSSGVDYYAKEPGTFMLISMLVPDPSYCQGLHPDLYGINFADDFNPELSGIGFTSVPRHRFSMMPEGFSTPTVPGNVWFNNGAVPVTSDPSQVSVGEEVAWSWLRTDYPRLHGEFAQNGSFQYWTLVRRFTEHFVSDVDSSSARYSDYSYYGTYVNPLSWQYLFTGTSFADPNFIMLAQLNLTVTSSVPANYMPYLGR